MSNRTDFHALVRELAEQLDLPGRALERLETELHNAYVAGEEGHGCECRWCLVRLATDSGIEYREPELGPDGQPTGRWLRKHLLGPRQ